MSAVGGQEFKRIRWLRAEAARARPPSGPKRGRLVLGIGDDAALWSAPPGHAAVLTVDVQVDGVHFRRDWLTPAQLGARAVAISASDLAAMAARPAGVLLSIVLPRSTEERFFRDLFRGAAREARREGLAVLGGNLSAGPLAVSVTAVGFARPGEAIGRRGARPGDGVYVTGWPGRARIGRALLELLPPPGRPGRGAGGRREAARAQAGCLRAFRSPSPRLREALYLGRRVRPAAMIDVSDGVAQDLSHLLAESRRRGKGPGAVLEPDRLVALLGERGAAAISRNLGLDPRSAALTGGEDYELLFTSPPGRAERLAPEFRKKFGIPLTRIGTVVARPGLWSEDGRRIEAAGFDHFR